MTREQLRAALTERDALTCTLLGEAGGEPIDGQIAVGCVIRNRAASTTVHWWGKGIKGVCLAPAQFSCWWERAQNTDRVYATAEALLARHPVGPLVAELQWIAEGIIGGVIRDHVAAADHYMTTELFRRHPPVWAQPGRVAPVAIVGHHTFFRLM